MAAQTAANVSAASPIATGGILVAPKGSTLPTTGAATLDAAFVGLGYVGEGGIEPSGEGASYKDIMAWGGDTVTSVLETKSITKYSFTLLEVFNGDVAKLVFGTDNVTITPATVSSGTLVDIEDKGDEIPRKVFVFEMAYGAKKLRYVFPDAQLAVTGEGPLVHNDTTNYQVELTAYPDSTGVRSYRYLTNDDVTAGVPAPFIRTVTPTGQSVGEQVLIDGHFFDAAITAFTIDGQAVTAYTVVDADTIVATIPANAAGAADVIITNATGASNTVSYTVV